ncbi:hypothetical protein [Bartonella tamiae]|uniref:Uncharacterized protein n=1 Tax=Bartonella tamiae Th239 TaxID=1094558 RepID=J1JXS6_9HYPH|nr:hypothetical protein [Bartonella tamiae]EJF89430.1 hypothetical protein ME5_01981 [Bartonella tamiae Th239]EJF92705.1 hypothetical protein MEG_01875 [Bartonella tamiae Th307]
MYAYIVQDALQWNSELGAYDASHGIGSPENIVNVANAKVEAGSTDAVFGSQLWDTISTDIINSINIIRC